MNRNWKLVRGVVSRAKGRVLDPAVTKATAERAMKEAVRERVSETLNESEED